MKMKDKYRLISFDAWGSYACDKKAYVIQKRKWFLFTYWEDVPGLYFSDKEKAENQLNELNKKWKSRQYKKSKTK